MAETNFLMMCTYLCRGKRLQIKIDYMVIIIDLHIVPGKAVFLYLNIIHNHTSFQLVTRDKFNTLSSKKSSPNTDFDLSMSIQQPGCESHHANYYR